MNGLALTRGRGDQVPSMYWQIKSMYSTMDMASFTACNNTDLHLASDFSIKYCFRLQYDSSMMEVDHNHIDIFGNTCP